MIVKNPLDKDISIKFKGLEYTIPAGKPIEIPDDVAIYWKNKIHTFIELAIDALPFVEVKKKKDVEEVEEEEVKAKKVTKK